MPCSVRSLTTVVLQRPVFTADKKISSAVRCRLSGNVLNQTCRRPTGVLLLKQYEESRGQLGSDSCRRCLSVNRDVQYTNYIATGCSCSAQFKGNENAPRNKTNPYQQRKRERERERSWASSIVSSPRDCVIDSRASGASTAPTSLLHQTR